MKIHWYLLALLFPALALAQDFERMDFVMDELDMETGSCLPKYKQALTRITQLTNTATKAKKQLRQCHNKLNAQPKVVTKNIDPNPQLLEQASQLSTSVAAS